MTNATQCSTRIIYSVEFPKKNWPSFEFFLVHFIWRLAYFLDIFIREISGRKTDGIWGHPWELGHRPLSLLHPPNCVTNCPVKYCRLRSKILKRNKMFDGKRGNGRRIRNFLVSNVNFSWHKEIGRLSP